MCSRTICLDLCVRHEELSLMPEIDVFSPCESWQICNQIFRFLVFQAPGYRFGTEISLKIQMLQIFQESPPLVNNIPINDVPRGENQMGEFPQILT